jgi:hypothetical protein
MQPATYGLTIGLLGVMIPLLATVLGLGVAFWAIYWDHRKKQLQYEERRLMIEKGLTPPPAFPNEQHTPEECLRTGTIMVFLGIGLGLAHFVLQNAGQPGPLRWLCGVGAAVVGLYGIGNLVYYFIARNRPAQRA